MSRLRLARGPVPGSSSCFRFAAVIGAAVLAMSIAARTWVPDPTAPAGERQPQSRSMTGRAAKLTALAPDAYAATPTSARYASALVHYVARELAVAGWKLRRSPLTMA